MHFVSDNDGKSHGNHNNQLIPIALILQLENNNI